MAMQLLRELGGKASAAPAMLSMAQAALRGGSSWAQLHALSTAAPGPLRRLTAADHERMLQACQTSVELVKADRPPAQRTFQPSPMDQMSQGLAFNFSYFYRGRPLRPDLLRRALAGLLGELPQLAGRGAVAGAGSRMADARVECGNQGAELATSAAPGISLRDVGPHTWSAMTGGVPLGKGPVAFWLQPMDPEAVRAGKEAPAKIRLTDLADGQVLSVTVWHMLSDAGRAISLASRLAAYYRAVATGRPVEGPPLTSDTRLVHSPADLLEGLADKPAQPWMPAPAIDDRMTLRQWLRTPAALHRFARRRWDVHTLYFPRATVERVKQAVTAAAGPGPRLSTNDCMTALLLTLQNELRGRPLVPAEGHVVTSNSDMLASLKLNDGTLAARFFGNAAGIVFKRGKGQGFDAAAHGSREDGFMAAAAQNARFIRQGISDYRANHPSGPLESVASMARMVQLPRIKVVANVVVKQAEELDASFSSTMRFPLQELDFGTGAPLHMHVHMLPWFEWWSNLAPAVGIDDGQGILVRSTTEHGLAQRLREHPVWRGVAAGAQLALGGETAEPFGQQQGAAAESDGEEVELAAAAA